MLEEHIKKEWNFADLSVEDQAEYERWLSENPLSMQLHIIEKETNISKERFEEIRAQYMHISRAVGTTVNGKVDHER